MMDITTTITHGFGAAQDMGIVLHLLCGVRHSIIDLQHLFITVRVRAFIMAALRIMVGRVQVDIIEGKLVENCLKRKAGS
jgi:hypothetical protein